MCRFYLWSFVSLFYSEIQDSSPVTNSSRKWRSLPIHSRKSRNLHLLLFFWSPVRYFGTIFAQLFLVSNLLVGIRRKAIIQNVESFIYKCFKIIFANEWVCISVVVFLQRPYINLFKIKTIFLCVFHEMYL